MVVWLVGIGIDAKFGANRGHRGFVVLNGQLTGNSVPEKLVVVVVVVVGGILKIVFVQ